jgi:serine/threonine protein kinase
MLYPKTIETVFHAAKYQKAPMILDHSKDQIAMAASFIERCIYLDVNRRASAAELLQHPWLREIVITRGCYMIVDRIFEYTTRLSKDGTMDGILPS